MPDRIAVCVFLLFDAIIFMMLMKFFNDDEIEVGHAISLLVAYLLVTLALVAGLYAMVGVLGGTIGLVVSVGLMGIALSALFGMEIKRAMGVSSIMTAFHVFAVLLMMFFYK